MLAYKTMVWRNGRDGRVVASWLQVVCLKTFERLIWGIDLQVKAMFKQGKLEAKGLEDLIESVKTGLTRSKVLCGEAG